MKEIKVHDCREKEKIPEGVEVYKHENRWTLIDLKDGEQFEVFYCPYCGKLLEEYGDQPQGIT